MPHRPTKNQPGVPESPGSHPSPTGDPLSTRIAEAVARACAPLAEILHTSPRDHALALLFVKRVGALNAARMAALRAEYAGLDPETADARIARRMARARFRVPDTADFARLYAERANPDIGERLNRALDALETENPEKLAGVFRNVDFNTDALGAPRERARRLKDLLEALAAPELDLAPGIVADADMAAAFTDLIARFADTDGESVHLNTPEDLAALIARIAAPAPGQRIYDPVCGAATLLVQAAQTIEGGDFALYGQEKNGGRWALARMHTILHGLDAARLAWGDTLAAPAFIEDGALATFDTVLANPPFSKGSWGADSAQHDAYGRFERGLPPASRGDFAFISHMLASAAPGTGRVVTAVAHGALFRGGTEGRIRKRLLAENLVDAVIALPEKLYPAAGHSIALIVLDRGREAGGPRADRRDVMFIDASDTYAPGRQRNRLTDDGIARIADTLAERGDIDGFSRRVAPDALDADDGVLSVHRYVMPAPQDDRTDLAALQAEIDALEAERAELGARVAARMQEVAHLV